MRILGLVILAAIVAAVLSVPHVAPIDFPSLPWDRTYQSVPDSGPVTPTSTATHRPSAARTPAAAPSSHPASVTPAGAGVAYHMALRAVAAETSEFNCDDDRESAEECAGFLEFLAGLEAATPAYEPGHFVGVRWRCGDETCYAGEVWDGSATSLHTGP